MKLLSHIRVLDLGRFITAPLAGQLLGELGADVVKVESRDAIDPFAPSRAGCTARTSSRTTATSAAWRWSSPRPRGRRRCAV